MRFNAADHKQFALAADGNLNAIQGPGWALAAATAHHVDGGGSARTRPAVLGSRRLQNHVEQPDWIVHVHMDGTDESDLQSEQTDDPPEEPLGMLVPTGEPYGPAPEPYELTEAPYVSSPEPAQAEVADAPAPWEDLEQGDDGVSSVPEAMESEGERRPVWYGSVEDGSYQSALGKGYDSWQAQVRTTYS